MDLQSSQQSVSASSKARKRGPAPGLWPAASVTVLSAALCLTWLMSDLATPTASDNGPDGSQLAPVESQDIEGALATLEGSPAFLAQFRQKAAGCPTPLASIVVSPAAGQSAGTVRIRSGGYFSPDFKLAGAPVRIAIPYPAGYETGHGVLTVLHSGGDAIVALTPPWHITAQAASTAHDVTWRTNPRCKQPNG
jgi:hypothetical protein